MHGHVCEAHTKTHGHTVSQETCMLLKLQNSPLSGEAVADYLGRRVSERPGHFTSMLRNVLL